MARGARVLTFVLLPLAACGEANQADVSRADAGDPVTTDAASGSPDASDEPPTSCTGRAAMEGDSVIALTVGASERTARLHVPEGYDPTRRTPLVLSFHGSTSNGTQQEFFSRLLDKSDSAGFVAVHPEGLDGSWNAGTCCDTSAANDVDDVGFVRALLEKLEAELCVAPKQIFVTGMSNGGQMAHRLGCELADRIAAIAPVAGGDMTETCVPSRPIAVMHFHGTSDTTVPYEGDATHPPVVETIAAWVSRNECESTTTETFAKGDSRCETHDACADGVEVTLCTVMEGGHTWPGGVDIDFLGKTSHDLVANDAMWEFFQRHPLP